MVVVGVVVARVAMIVGVAIIIDIAIVVALVIAVVVSSALSFTLNDVLRLCVVVAIVVASVVACRCLVCSCYRGGFQFLPAFVSACAGPHFSYAKDSAQASLMSGKNDSALQSPRDAHSRQPTSLPQFSPKTEPKTEPKFGANFFNHTLGAGVPKFMRSEIPLCFSSGFWRHWWRGEFPNFGASGGVAPKSLPNFWRHLGRFLAPLGPKIGAAWAGNWLHVLAP